MPLHLLGKKSWNVYNADNIARVRRDEAAAKAAEEAEEERMQEIDAARRLAILRGEKPPALEIEAEKAPGAVDLTRSRDPSSFSHRPKRKRKRAGEDDTEFELRLAQERNEVQNDSLEVSKKASSSAPIMDRSGHIDLFGDERSRAHGEKNKEAEEETKRKTKELEGKYTMRFSNAAGRDGFAQGPWYSNSDGSAPSQPTTDVWGNDDPKRKVRHDQRLAANDPLAAMRSGASRVREIKAERKKLQTERQEELEQLRREQRHKERRERRSDRSPRRESSRESRRHRHKHSSSERREDGERHSDRRRSSHRDRSSERRWRSHRSHSPDHSRSHRHEKAPV